jgi:hypothetical protein
VTSQLRILQFVPASLLTKAIKQTSYLVTNDTGKLQKDKRDGETVGGMSNHG